MAKVLKELKTGREDKTIGVEIEFYGVNYQTVVSELNRAGIDCRWERYTHATMPVWKLVYDVSVTKEGTGARGGLELVSPPLKSKEMKNQLKIVCHVLNNIGAKVDRTCGIHVHHDISDLDLNNIKVAYQLYKKHVVSLDTFFPPSRENNRYCKALDESIEEGLKQAQSINDLRYLLDDRYYKLNFTSYSKYGTLEFRQHAGSTDFDKIWRWIRITQQILAASKRKRKVSPLSAHMATRQTLAFTRDIFLEGTEEAEFFRTRRIEMKRARA